MGRAVMRKAAGEITLLHEIVGEGLEHVVERVLAMRPVAQEMADIGPAAVARRADQRRRHLYLVEGLVPDVVQPVGRGHPRTDAGIDEIEEQKTGDALW